MNFILIILIFCAACHSRPPREVLRAFYFWKSNFALQPFEKKSVQDLEVKKIYLKYFDVAEREANRPSPIAQVSFAADTKCFLRQNGIELIPVVFITNQSLEKPDTTASFELGEKIADLIYAINQQQEIKGIRQVQIDCDWSKKTKANFFSLLRGVKSKLDQGQLLSATIRLHQLKFKLATGIPPVDRGALMCYNMGNLKDPTSKNSILDVDEMKRYIGSLASYELPLDIALPIFDWKVLFRNKSYAGLISSLPDSMLSGGAVKQTGQRFEFIRDTTIGGYLFNSGDWLRNEQQASKTIFEAGDLVSKKLSSAPTTVILYHLDSLNLIKYKPDELEDMFNRLR